MFARLPAQPGAFSEADIQQYVDALSAPGALTAALNYYRANAGPNGLAATRGARIMAETLVIWGDRDPALETEVLEGIESVAPRTRVHHIPSAGHWVQNEAPAEVNRVLVDFLSRGHT